MKKELIFFLLVCSKNVEPKILKLLSRYNALYFLCNNKNPNIENNFLLNKELILTNN